MNKYNDIKFITLNGIVIPIKKTELEIESDAWGKKLTNKELHAIRKYTKNSLEKDGIAAKLKFYYLLNRYLEEKQKGKRTCNSFYENYSNLISQGLNKFNFKKPVICYRKSSVDETSGLEEGKSYIQPSFYSTSIDPDAFPEKGYTYTILVPPKARGAYIANISRYKKQKELLLDKNTKFKVISRQGKKIKLEVIV